MKYRFKTGNCYYINCTGSRWIIEGYTVRAIGTVNGKPYDKIRKVDYFESFGNFGTSTIRIGGKRYTGFLQMELPNGFMPENDSPAILDLDKCRVAGK